MSLPASDMRSWMDGRVIEKEISKYMDGKEDFIPDAEIEEKIKVKRGDDPARIRDIIQKSMTVETLTPDETATLLNVQDENLWEEMKDAAGRVKKKVYDNRIVTFAPLYLGNLCVNNCSYCGFRCENAEAERRVLTPPEIRREIEVLAGEIGHKRLIVVYGEHPKMDVNYIADSIKNIYSVQVKTKKGVGQIRRVNVNAPSMSIADLKKLHDVGIGTYQVFQETYHHDTYQSVHPAGTIKADYRWRLYCMHRAFEAGIDDFGLGVLFGLYDWKFEVMGLLYHAIELERRFGVGPHTISFPRLEHAQNAPVTDNSKYKVSDEDFMKLITVLRLAVPHSGMILTARETADIRRCALPLGITQIDASTKIGIGAYSEELGDQHDERQQFILGDTRSLDEVIGELAGKGYITSFCTAGYRCGRTGKCIMELLKSGEEGKFCKLNAILTFREWLDDFASPKTRAAGEKVIEREIEEIKLKMPKSYSRLMEGYEKIQNGERDIYF
jgi:2-iminoacetate synthase